MCICLAAKLFKQQTQQQMIMAALLVAVFFPFFGAWHAGVRWQRGRGRWEMQQNAACKKKYNF